MGNRQSKAGIIAEQAESGYNQGLRDLRRGRSLATAITTGLRFLDLGSRT
jgi:hypothetical protein